jgi:hypothetical protein
MTMAMPAGWDVAEVNRWIEYHGENSKPLIAQRTSLESKLIPVSAYILIAAVECYRRHPEMVLEIDAAMPAEQIGAAGRRPGTQVNAVNIWSQANIFLHGRQILTVLGAIPPDHEPARTAVVLDFWRRAAEAYHGEGRHAAWDTGIPELTPYDRDVIDDLYAATVPLAVGDGLLPAVKRLNALLMSYLFLLYFDTRAGIGDTGPYRLSNRRIMLVRDFSKLSASDFPWSAEVAKSVPYQNLTAAFVLDGVTLRVNDWGTSMPVPDDYLDHVVRFGLFTTDRGKLEPVPALEWDGLISAVKDAQRKTYRRVAEMSRRERIDAGAYVYFTFLRPFADVAGIAGRLDWNVPRESLDVYPMIEPFEGTNTPPDPDAPYYLLFPEST